jgi:endonuclease YncB( thermonuclease family)
MRKNIIAVFLVLLIILSSCTPDPSSPPPTTQTPSATPALTDTVTPAPTLKPGQERALVIEVIDGVTIMVEMKGETMKVCYEATFLSGSYPDEIKDEAMVVNRALVEGKTVILEKGDYKPDRDECHYRFVFLEDGTFVNVELLRRGLAWYAPRRGWIYENELDEAKQEAQTDGIGRWGYPTATPAMTMREIARATEVTYYRNLNCTMTSPPPVLDPLWNGAQLNAICLEVEQSYPEIDSDFYQPIFEITKQILARVGMNVLLVGETCDATLEISIAGKANPSSYYVEGGTASCYNGTHGQGTIRLTAPGFKALEVPIFGGYTPFMISHCYESPPSAPNNAYERYWEMAVLKGLAELWGPAVPIQALNETYEGQHLSSAMYNGAAQALLSLPYEECALPALIHALLITNDKDARDSIGLALGNISGDITENDPENWITWWTSVE